MRQFSYSGGRFCPGFSETDKIRMVTVNKVENSSRMKWVKNRTDIERTDSEVSGSRIRFNIASEKK